MAANTSIRSLTDADRDEAVRVINDAARWYADILPPDEVAEPEMTPDQWSAEADRMTWFGAHLDGQLAGVIGLEYRGDVALLRHWYVAPHLQRGGIGSRLREHLEEQASGVDRIVAGTYAANIKARRALEAAGYHLSPDPLAVLDAYYDIPPARRATSVTYELSVRREHARRSRSSDAPGGRAPP